VKFPRICLLINGENTKQALGNTTLKDTILMDTTLKDTTLKNVALKHTFS